MSERLLLCQEGWFLNDVSLVLVKYYVQQRHKMLYVGQHCREVRGACCQVGEIVCIAEEVLADT